MFVKECSDECGELIKFISCIIVENLNYHHRSGADLEKVIEIEDFFLLLMEIPMDVAFTPESQHLRVTCAPRRSEGVLRYLKPLL